MRSLPVKIARFSIIVACSAAVATGCMLDRRPILPGWGRVTPAQYCPGDTLRASYDFLGSETCSTSPSVTCSDFFPTVTVSSTPALFPAQDLPRGYQGNFDFTASGDSVTVGFHSNQNPVTIPVDRPEGVVLLQRTGISDTNATARRIMGTQSFELTHTGMCEGASHVYAPGDLNMPSLSPNMRLIDVCNFSGTILTVTLSGGASGAVYSQMVPPGMCLDTGMPGLPAGIDGARIVEVRPLTPDPAARCSATGPNTPPATLRTVAHMACR